MPSGPLWYCYSEHLAAAGQRRPWQATSESSFSRADSPSIDDRELKLSAVFHHAKVQSHVLPPSPANHSFIIPSIEPRTITHLIAYSLQLVISMDSMLPMKIYEKAMCYGCRIPSIWPTMKMFAQSGHWHDFGHTE